MCGPCSASRARTIDSGDLLAIIHPSPSASPSTAEPEPPQFFAGATLHLSNRQPGPTQSTFSLLAATAPSRSPSPSPSASSSSEEDCDELAVDGSSSPPLRVQIHEFSETSAVLHAFSAAASCSGSSSTGPATRLDLGVGGAGIVGRTVSVVDARERVLGVGVVGWGR